MPISPLSKDRGYMGDPARGASLGRCDTNGDPDENWKFHLVRVPLNSGGYDSGGAYWGLGAPLWRYEAAALPATPTDLDLPDGFLRARSREAAKSDLRDLYPGCRFFR